jgi:hypothetical protein
VIGSTKLSVEELERLTGIEIHTPHRAVASTKSSRFVERIPLAWIQCAAQLPGKSVRVALAIWYQVNIEGRHEIAMTPTKLQRFGATRWAGNRAMAELEGAGLIRVVRKAGRSPRVQILDAPAHLGQGSQAGQV